MKSPELKPQGKALVLICPKTEEVCPYGLRELDPEFCSWCGQLQEIRQTEKQPRKRKRRV